MKRVFGKRPLGYLDYVACWIQKGAEYLRDGIEAAFVSTNSICQGQQVATLWPGIMGLGVEISFAYQTFPWRNSAQGNAGVHVVIVGLRSECGEKNKFLYQNIEGGWHCRQVENISPYLLEGRGTVVESRRSPFGGASRMVFGSKPTDGGRLILSEHEREALLVREPKLVPWVKPLIGSQEFFAGSLRWCLWLVGAPEDILSIPEVKSRIDAVRDLRVEAGHAAALLGATRPHQFLQVAQPEEGGYILVPSVSSERRLYAPVGMFDCNVIANNLVQIIPGGTLYEFAILSTQMHMDWLRLVGGRLESRYRYSATIVYNTFPWPDASERQRQEIEQLGREVILARAAHPDKTMAQLYDPDKMPENLLEAHQALDRAVEKLYRDRPFRDTAERQEYLLARYEELIEAEKAAKVGGKKKTRKATTTEG